MGGAAAGEVASRMAVDVICDRMSGGAAPESLDELARLVVSSIEAAGHRICAESRRAREFRGMGTTATVAVLAGDRLLVGQVGDSRAYVLRGDRLVAVTRDQSLVAQLVEAGKLTEEEAAASEDSNVILQALGSTEAVDVDLTHVELRRGDALLLCSDGLTCMLRHEEIRWVLLRVPDPREACEALARLANEAGGVDNVTAIVARVGGPSLAVATSGDVTELRYEKYRFAAPAPEVEAPAPAPTPPPPALTAAEETDVEPAYDVLPMEPVPGWLVVAAIAGAVAAAVVCAHAAFG